MRPRQMWPVAVLLLVCALAGCGDDGDDPESSDDTTTSATPSETGATSTTEAVPSAAPAGLPAACDAVSTAEVSAAYGVDFAEGGGGTGTTTEQGVKWTSDNCNFVATDLVEVNVKLTGPDDFTAGDFHCPEPVWILATVEPVDDVVGADEAWWKASESPPLEATLRVCTAAANVDIDLEYEDGVDLEGDPRTQTIALAEQVLSAL